MNQAVLEVPVSPSEIVDDPYSLVFRFNVDQFQELIDLGIIEDGAPFELLDGIIFRKNRADIGENLMVHGARHAALVERLNLLLSQAAAQLGLRFRSQLPLMLGPDSAPEPDFALITPLAVGAPVRHPQGNEVLLVIEIALSSLTRDRNRKLAIYAKAGIAEYWVLNPAAKQLERFQLPNIQDGRYQPSTVLTFTEMVEVPGLDGKSVSIPVADLL